MAARERRDALRGAEGETIDLLSEALGSEQWAELLRVPLERAAGEGNRGLAQKLAEAGAGTGMALHEAVLGGHEETVNDLLKSGASVAARDTIGNTPLHVAAREGNPEMVRVLMLKGADKDDLDMFECTPLYLAVSNCHFAAALALLTAEADVHRRFTVMKWSVVHTAAQHDLLEFVKAAIEHEANLDAADIHQNTALHLAATQNSAGTIAVLIEGGANTEARN